MDHVVGSEGKKVAVHCHAGLGRTGLAIACYFVYTKVCTGTFTVLLLGSKHMKSAGSCQGGSSATWVFEVHHQSLTCTEGSG